MVKVFSLLMVASMSDGKFELKLDADALLDIVASQTGVEFSSIKGMDPEALGQKLSRFYAMRTGLHPVPKTPS
jgi:hypothetical protein